MNSFAATPADAQADLDIGLSLKHGGRLFLKDIGALLIATLIAGALSIITLGILAGPLIAGLYGMVVGRVRDGRRPRVGDVFAGFDRFWAYFFAALVLAVLVGLASITIVGGFVLATIWLYVFPLMVDRRMRLGEAMKTSKDMVFAGGFWEHLALVLIGFAIGTVAHGILAVISMPFTIAVVAAAYFIVGGKAEALEKA